MNKLLFSALFCLISITTYAESPINLASTEIVAGNALKINSCCASRKALFMKNATLDDKVDVIAWTETYVPAQRWIVQDAGQDFFNLVNAYSQHSLSGSTPRPKDGEKIILRSNNPEYSKWTFVPVTNKSYPNAYYILYSKKTSTGANLYLGLSEDKDGASVTMQIKSNTADSLRQMWTVTSEKILPNRVTPSFRDSVMAGWKKRYYNMVKTSTGFWGEAEIMETILDAYETTGKKEYKTMFEEVYEHFVSYPAGWYQPGNGQDWRWNDFNDDIAWAVLASVRAYLILGEHPNSGIKYLDIARNNYDWMYSRALLPSSMLRWKETPQGNLGSNSCINGPAEVAACYLAIATGDDSYYEKAKNLYALQRKHLYEPGTGKVFDSGSWNGNVFTVGNRWVSTYNQGTFLGAALMLHNHYGDAQYLNDAHKIVEWTREGLCNSDSVVSVCGSGDDLQGFKGILMRYLRRYVVDLGLPKQVDWLQRNALQGYNNRNSAGVIWTAWWEKSAENFIYSDGYDFSNKAFGCSTALSAAFNAPLSSDLIIKDGFKIIEAENFDYIRGILVEREDDLTAVVSIGASGNYTAYNHVDFGEKKAIKMEFQVELGRPRGQKIEIRLDSPTGELIGTAEIPSGNIGTLATVTCQITETIGKHNIYLVYTGSSFKVDKFRFISEGTDNIDDAEASMQLQLYPNPVVDDLIIDCPKGGRLVVHNVQGKEIDSTTIDGGITTLNVANYPSGIYFLTINAEGMNYFSKFFKK